jgi:hypothetical protein
VAIDAQTIVYSGSGWRMSGALLKRGGFYFASDQHIEWHPRQRRPLGSLAGAAYLAGSGARQVRSLAKWPSLGAAQPTTQKIRFGLASLGVPFSNRTRISAS